MSGDDNARDMARRIVYETLDAAGASVDAVAPPPAPGDRSNGGAGPPRPPSDAQRIAHRLVRDVVHDAALSSVRQDDGTSSASSVKRSEPRQAAASAGQAAERTVVTFADPDPPEPDPEPLEPDPDPDETRLVAREAHIREAGEELPPGESPPGESPPEELPPEEWLLEESPVEEPAPTAPRMSSSSSAAPEVDTEAPGPSIWVPPEQAELDTDPADVASRLVAEALAAAASAEAAAASVEAAAVDPVPDILTPDPAGWPTAGVDLLPEADPTLDVLDRPESPPPNADPGSPAPVGSASSVVDDTSVDQWILTPGPQPSGPVLDTWLQRLRARRQRRFEVNQWAPDATPPPRRTWRWLLATVIAAVAIAVLFPLAVAALRDLVAL